MNDQSGHALLASLPAALKRDLNDLGCWSRTLDNRQRPLQAIVRQGAAIIHAMEEGGLQQHRIVRLLAAAGIRRADGTPFPEKSLSSALRRERASQAPDVTQVTRERRGLRSGDAAVAAHLQNSADHAKTVQAPAAAGNIPQVPARSGSAQQSPAHSASCPHTEHASGRQQEGAEKGACVFTGVLPKCTEVDLDDAADLLLRQRSERQ